MSDQKFGSWSAPESPLTIEYSLVAIEEIRREVADGFQKLSRGGIEVGGIIYGNREGRTVRIQAIRPIACEHARGPAFLLSDKDKAELAAQLAADDPRLEGMIAVGWYLSHTRSEISLTDSDLEIYSTYFPAPWQVTMVIRPGRAGSMRAGFFIREADGTVKSDASYMEFNFPDRLAGVLDRPPRSDRPEDRPTRQFERRASPPRAEAAAAPAYAPVPFAAPDEVPPQPSFTPNLGLQPEPRSRRWLPIALSVGALAIVVLLGLRWFDFGNLTPRGGGGDPMGLTVLERDGQLVIEWNRQSGPVASATKGTLEIIDGGASQPVALAPADLARGKFTYERRTGDIQVRLSVENSAGKRSEEGSRYLGGAPRRADSGELEALKQKRSDLEAEIARLKEDNDRQAGRIQQLERTLRILQARLGLEAGKQQ